MKRLIIATLLITTSIYTQEFDPTILTFENLAQNHPTDYVLVFQELFKEMPYPSILEIGSGYDYGAKYLLENWALLTSYEIVVKDNFYQVMPWFKKINGQLKSFYPHWQIEMHTFSDKHSNEANNLARTGKNPQDYDTQYLTEINKFFEKICTENSFDIIFIDSALLLRADLVNEAFNRSNVIIAHDTNTNTEIYGWNRLKTPDNYTKIHFNYGSGTTIWIKNEQSLLINNLKTQLRNKQFELTSKKIKRSFFQDDFAQSLNAFKEINKEEEHTNDYVIKRIYDENFEESTEKKDLCSIEKTNDCKELQWSLWEQLSDSDNTNS